MSGVVQSVLPFLAWFDGYDRGRLRALIDAVI